jgi:hypothetical protein
MMGLFLNPSKIIRNKDKKGNKNIKKVTICLKISFYYDFIVMNNDIRFT